MQARCPAGAGVAMRRRHAYGVALFFLLAGLMSPIASIDSDVSGLWRAAFGACGAIGLVEVGLFLRPGGVRTGAALALRRCGLGLPVLIVLVALAPQAIRDASVGPTPQELESVLLGLPLFVGANLVWLGLTEPLDPAAA